MEKTWYTNPKIGKLKEWYYVLLQQKYQFQSWHITPINFRPYAIDVVEYLNRQTKRKVIEIGCGLGEIIGNVSNCERVGYDIDEKVVMVAKKLYRNTHFYMGTFENVKNQKIDYLITVNFIHGISPEELKKIYERLYQNNEIRHFVLDIVDSSNYRFNHDINYLIEGTGYKIQKRLHRHQVVNGSRWIYILEKE